MVVNPSKQPYNKRRVAHIRTRNVIERAFGVLKSRFRSLDTSGGTLMYSPRKACDITVACVILHNICISNRIPIQDPDPRDAGRIQRVQYHGHINDGVNVRGRIIAGRFSE